ncbi:hypothetical protein [Aurantiacibacter aquimixticola]|uniref:Lipoprotein n=1 Tax=Aurantiacibacter aquimixticola TaxID=1958945 RepID=A0A419RUA8_9SPHN|nr:hypothetical protein [Aurantiacibacter aquimixticola]RJY09334.1 hypothetical protein D6201_08175 [Aurantiacibacter aquimixticola]
MRKTIIPAILTGALLSGCTAIGTDPLGGLLGGIFGGDDSYGYDRNLSRFERAAVQACGREASRYGRVAIRDVEERRDVVRVRGRIDNRNRDRDEFECVFRDDGRIVDFDLD